MTFKHIMFEWTILIKAHPTTFNILPSTKIKKTRQYKHSKLQIKIS